MNKIWNFQCSISRKYVARSLDINSFEPARIIKDFPVIDYARLEFDETTTNHLFQFSLDHNLGLADVKDRSRLKVDDFKFHLTIIYSRVNSPYFLEGEQDFSGHILQPTTFDMFGPNEDVLVLKIKADAVLTSLNAHYKDVYGHVPAFDPFRPHITFRGSNSSNKAKIEKLPVPSFQLRADRLIHKIKVE